MLKKRGQLTIFIIIAIVIMSLAILFYFVFPNIKILNEESSSPVHIYVKECLEDTIIYSAYIFGLQQGHYTIPRNSLDTGISKIAYYYNEGEILIPSNEFFEKEFSNILDEEIRSRCSDFLDFEVEGYYITTKDSSNDIKILENDLEVRIDYPITVDDGEETESFSKFSYELPIRLGHIFDVSRDLVDKIKEEPYTLDLTFLLNQDVAVSVDKYDSCNQIYIIVDEESISIDNNFYAYTFAVKIEDKYCVFEDENEF